MKNYLVGRLLAVIPTALILVLFVIVLIRLLPGDAVDIMLSEQAYASNVSRQELKARLGLDKPVVQQYVEYVAGLLRGDLGRSLWTHEAVTDIVRRKIGVTLELALFSLIAGATLGIALGVVSAAMQRTLVDYILRSIAILGLTIPNFALAIGVVVLPTLWWGWSPPLTYTPVSAGLLPHLSQFAAPVLVLSFGLNAVVLRLTRATMLDVLRQEYIRTALAKGLGAKTVLFRHGLQNALIPVVSLLGVQVALLVSGSVVVEQVFGLPGIGRQLISSLPSRDYPVVQGITVVSGLLVVFVNIAVDLSYVILDPRIKAK